MRIPVHWVTFPREVSQSWVEGTHFLKICFYLCIGKQGHAGAGGSLGAGLPSSVNLLTWALGMELWSPTPCTLVFSSLCSYANKQYFSIAIFCLREEAPHIPSLIFPAICNLYIRRARPLGNSKDPGGTWKVYFCERRETVEIKTVIFSAPISHNPIKCLEYGKNRVKFHTVRSLGRIFCLPVNV